MKIQPKLFITKEKEREKILEKIGKILKLDLLSLKIKFFSNKEKDSIGISEITELIEWAYLKKTEREMAIILNSQKLTIEAQNALLKLLEEPPEFTYIVLVSVNADLLLSTILSRIEIVIDTEKSVKVSLEKTKFFLEANLLERLRIIDNMLLGDEPKTEAESLIGNLLEMSPKTFSNLDVLENLKLAYKALSKKGNVKQVLEFLVYNI